MKFAVKPCTGRSRKNGHHTTYWWGKHSFGLNLTFRWWREFKGLKVRLGFFNCRVGWFISET